MVYLYKQLERLVPSESGMARVLIFSLFFFPNPSSVYNASVNFHQANGLYFLFGVRIFQIKEDLSRIHQANPSHLWTPRKDISLQISWRSKTLEK